MPFTPPADTETFKYSREDRFRAVVQAIYNAILDPNVQPTNTDVFTNLEEKFWIGVADVAVLAALGGGSGSGGVFVRSTLTAARAVATASTNQLLVLTGNAAPNDGEGGTYTWDDTTTAADNFPLLFRPNDYSSGRGGAWVKFQ